MTLPKIRNIINSIGLRTALVNVLILIAAFALILLMIIQRGENVFSAVVTSGIPVQVGQVGQLETGSTGIAFNKFVGGGDATYFTSPDIIKFDVSGVPRAIPLDVEFRERLVQAVSLMMLFGLLLSVGASVLNSYLITAPLQKLKLGLQHLRENNYQQPLTSDEAPTEVTALVDEYNLLAQELRRVEELRKDLISDTTHELKTPITSLLTQLQGVKDKVLTLDDERIDLLLSQVNRLHDMTERLREFSQLRAKSRQLQTQQLTIRTVIAGIAKQYKQKLAEQSIQLVLNVPKDLAIAADKSLLEQLLGNLLENALRYSQADRITISADAKGLSFHDNGIGIPKQHLPHIFERFYRVEKSRSRHTGGLGLGLAIAKEIAEAHGWKLKVESLPKQGTSFVISWK